ncbi:redoxin domain-containing protein [candidate division KSB1 bacterium]|nr:redoxin domain-containing protein [candidate division KSB1 bacterium]
MSTLSIISDIAQWFFITSLKATIVIALIMMLRLVLGDRLPAKWQHALWFLLIVRLVLPINMPTPFSLFNLTDKVPYRPAPPAHLNIEYSSTPIEKPAAVSFNIRKQNPAVDNAVVVQSYSLSVMEIAGLVWLLGLASLLLYAAVLNLVTWLRFRGARPIEDSRLSTILKSSQKKLGVKKNIRLFQIEVTTSPFWFGQFRPRIYFPSALVESLSDKDLEHIFLHELAHFKRKDIFVSMMQTLLQAAHWFNPLIWYSFSRMRNDRETACDEMVLNALGQNRSEAYGLTLISLLRYANRNGLMPVTVGLADTQEDIRHRIDRIANFSIKSKWWEVLMFVLVLVISLLALTSATESASISGEITFQDGAQPDTIYVGLYDYNWRDDFFGGGGEPHALLKLTNTSSYTFNVEPGLYTVVTWGFGYENAHYKVFIENDQTDLEINFALPRTGLPESISHIALIGDYCGWDRNRAAQLTFTDGMWRTEAPDSMHIGQKYKFFVWEKGISDFQDFLIDPSKKPMYRYAPTGKPKQVSLNWGTFDHIYQGEKEFIIDPTKFEHPIKKAAITTQGWELADQFHQLYEDKYMLVLEMVEPLNNPETRHNLDIPAHYYRMRAKWDSLEAEYDPYFKDIFLENKLYLAQLFSPIRPQSRIIFNPEATQYDLKDFFESKAFHQYFTELLSFVKQLDLDSYFYEGDFVYNLCAEIPLYLHKWPDLAQEYDITYDECRAMLDDFVYHARNPHTREAVMYNMHSRLSDLDSTAAAEKYRTLLLKEFPDGFYAQALQRELNHFSWERVSPVPAHDFIVTTIDDQELRLHNFRGRFVFIDFWGTWCKPCTREIENIVTMSQLINNDKLQIIGLVKDEEKPLKKFLEQQKLPYPNALVDEDLLKQWEVQSFPTSFLINPDGHIIAKNIRGPKMGLEIGKEIAKWEF